MKMNNCRKLLGMFCWSAASALVGSAADTEILTAEALARIKTTVQAKDIEATWAACQEAAQLGGELLQDGPKGMTRREKLEFRLGVLDRVAAGIDKDNGKNEISYLNVGAPGVPVAGMDPKQIKDPAVRKEYERRIAENRQKVDRNRRNFLLEDLKAKWSEQVRFFTAQNYGKDETDISEIKSAINSTVSDPSLRAELEKLLGIDESSKVQ